MKKVWMLGLVGLLLTLMLCNTASVVPIFWWDLFCCWASAPYLWRYIGGAGLTRAPASLAAPPVWR